MDVRSKLSHPQPVKRRGIEAATRWLILELPYYTLRA